MNREERQQARTERYRELADNARKQSEQCFRQSESMASVIPMGQPVHGKADRNYREKIWNKMGQSVKASEKADYYERKAEAAENNNAIYLDDDNAVEKLEQKLEQKLDEKLEQKLDEKLERKLDEKLAPIRADITILKEQVLSLTDRMGRVEADIEDIRKQQERTSKIIENQLIPNIQLLAENYVPAARRYQESEQKQTAMENDIKLLKIVVADHSAKLCELAK